jgi:hypothetical protein
MDEYLSERLVDEQGALVLKKLAQNVAEAVVARLRQSGIVAFETQAEGGGLTSAEPRSVTIRFGRQVSQLEVARAFQGWAPPAPAE